MVFTSAMEELVARSPHNYDGLIVLVRLYMFQGAVTRAFDNYKRLDLKNMQHLSFSWILFPRISTNFPLKSRKHPFSPKVEMNAVTSWLKRADENARRWSLEFLQQGEYCHLLSHVDLQDCIARSVSSALLWTEAAKINEMASENQVSNTLEGQAPMPLLGVSADENFPDVEADVNGADDRNAFPEYGHPGRTKLVQILETGPDPGVSLFQTGRCGEADVFPGRVVSLSETIVVSSPNFSWSQSDSAKHGHSPILGQPKLVISKIATEHPLQSFQREPWI